MVTMKFFILLAFSCSFLDVINGSYYYEKECNVCQDKSANLTFDQVNARFKALVPRIWAQDIPLSRLGRKYKDIVLNFAENGNEDTSFLSIVSSVYLNNFLPYLDQKPDACVMAAMVNGTLSCVNTHDDTLIQSALSQLQDKFFDIYYNNMLTMIFSAGCDFRCGKSPPDPKIKKASCYGNGFVYPVQSLFNLDRRPYSEIAPELKNIVLDLYKSNNYLDNYIAACTAFAISEITQRLFVKWDPIIIIGAVEMALSDPVKQKCCYSRMKMADENRKANGAEAIRTITNEKAFLNITKCRD